MPDLSPLADLILLAGYQGGPPIVPAYVFRLPGAAAGRPVTVHPVGAGSRLRASGVLTTSGTKIHNLPDPSVSGTIGEDGTFTATLPVGDYVAIAPSGQRATVWYTAIEELAQPVDLESLSEDALRAAFGRPQVSHPVASTAGLQARGENRATPLAIPTPYKNVNGQDEAVHPSVVHVPGGFGGYSYWMAFTPYPGGAQFYENPSVVASHDGYTWETPAGLTNPVEPRATSSGSDFNSDTFLLHHDGKLWMFFRQVESTYSDDDRIYYRTSTDGVTWAPKVLVIAHDGDVRKLLSPSFHVRDGVWRMWAVEETATPNRIVRYTAVSPSGPWAGPEVVTGYTTTNGTWQPWHIDVQGVGDEYVLLMHETDTGQGKIGNLRRSVSQDGLTFDPDPALTMTGVIGSWDNGLYRACLLPTRIDGQDGYRMWYSAYGQATWKIGHALVKLESREAAPADLLAATIPAYPCVAGDSQVRADNPTSPGVLSSGQTWTVINGTWGVVGRAITASAGGYIGINLGVSSYEVGWTLAAVPEAAKQLYVLTGWDGTANGDLIRWGPNGPIGYTKHVRVGGAFEPTLTNPAFAPQAGDRIKVRFRNGEAKMYVNGMLLQQHSAPTLAGRTWTGLYASALSAGVRNFYAKVI